MDIEKIIVIIGAIGAYGLSFIVYNGLYWPLRIEYEGHSKRRLFQKTYASLTTIMASIGLVGTLINPGFKNRIGYYITLGLFILIVTMIYLNKTYFVKQKGIYQ